MKIKVFTHNDLDGYGVDLVIKAAFGKENVNTDYCTYSSINLLIKRFFNSKEYLNYDLILVGDISMNLQIAKWIDTLTDKIFLFDHHNTAETLNQISWCTVSEMGEIEETCGTEMMYNFLLNNSYLQRTDYLDKLVYTIRLYDTWLFKKKYNYIDSQSLNNLFKIYGGEDFINSYLERINNYKLGSEVKLFNNNDLMLLQVEEKRIKRYIQTKNEKLITTTLKLDKEYNVGISFGEQYTSEVGNTLCSLHPELDFIIIISNMTTLSFRTAKDNIDVSEIATYYNGGGHPQSAGAIIDGKFKKKILDQLLK